MDNVPNGGKANDKQSRTELWPKATQGRKGLHWLTLPGHGIGTQPGA